MDEEDLLEFNETEIEFNAINEPVEELNDTNLELDVIPLLSNICTPAIDTTTEKMSASASNVIDKTPVSWSKVEVGYWLESINLIQILGNNFFLILIYILDTFLTNEISGEVLIQLTEDEIKELIPKLGFRKIFTKHWKELVLQSNTQLDVGNDVEFNLEESSTNSIEIINNENTTTIIQTMPTYDSSSITPVRSRRNKRKVSGSSSVQNNKRSRH